MPGIRVGIKTGQGGYSYEELSRVWQKAEELGFESAWLYDHFVALGDSNADCLEAYAALAALARDTRRLRIGAMVTCAGYRNPAYFAKMTSTVDVISKGRLIVGLGAGWYEEEYKAYGYKFLSAPERVRQLRETIRILRAMWGDGRATFKGKHFSVEEAVNLPKPMQKHVPIWVGISKGTHTLPRVAVQEADGLNTVADVELCGKMIERAEEARKESGRSRDSVTYSVQKFLLMGNEKQMREIAADSAKSRQTTPENILENMKSRGWIMGSPEVCAEKLREYINAGVDYLVLGFAGDKLGWPLEVAKDSLLSLL